MLHFSFSFTYVCKRCLCYIFNIFYYFLYIDVIFFLPSWFMLVLMTLGDHGDPLPFPVWPHSAAHPVIFVDQVCGDWWGCWLALPSFWSAPVIVSLAAFYRVSGVIWRMRSGLWFPRPSSLPVWSDAFLVGGHGVAFASLQLRLCCYFIAAASAASRGASGQPVARPDIVTSGLR